MDLNRLNEVLRYNQEAERASFEKAIDANPLDSTTHLVYADWLQENGHEQEAAFRRAMGEWFGKHEFNTDESPHDINNKFHTSSAIADPSLLPNGVDGSKLQFRLGRIADGEIGQHFTTGRIGWDTYRDMESAFRKAFKPSSS